jgi:signal transduction histidine kinase
MIDLDVTSLLRALPGCHLFLSPDPPRFSILEVTETYLEATLLDRTIIGRGLLEVLLDNPTFYHPVDIANLDASLLRVLEQKSAHYMGILGHDIPGPPHNNFALGIWNAINKPVTNNTGEVQYLIHTVEDVTRQVGLLSSEEQAQSELADTSLKLARQRQLTETILTASLNGIYALDAIRNSQGKITDFRYLFANNAIAAYLSLDAKDMVGSSVLELIPENKDNGFFDYFCNVLEKGVPERQQSYFASTNFNGWFDFTIVPISGDVLVVTTQDITTLKENQLSLEQTVQELKRSNEHLEEFVHAASHDLKEPIRKIRFFTDKLKEQLQGQLGENEIRSFSKIENASQRMGGLVEDLILYSHVSQRPREKESVDLNIQLQKIVEELELDIQEKGARVHIGILPQVRGYRRQLQQLFQNLVSNALKYSMDGQAPEIAVTAESSELDGISYHVIIVHDNGIGFEQKHSEKIFQIFFRLHGTSSYSGTGVGLSIARKVAENHNGFIRVSSRPKKGATFKVYLPVN